MRKIIPLLFFGLCSVLVHSQALPTSYNIAGHSDCSAINFTAQDSSGYVVLSWTNAPFQANNVIIGLESTDTSGSCSNWQYFCLELPGTFVYGDCGSHIWDAPIWYFQDTVSGSSISSVRFPYNKDQFSWRENCIYSDGILNTYYVTLQSVRPYQNLACKFLFEYAAPLSPYLPCGIDTSAAIAPVTFQNGVARFTKPHKK